MIELRWLEKVKTLETRGCEYIEKVRVLQYRTQNMNVDGYLIGTHWGDWQDVPTVREE